MLPFIVKNKWLWITLIVSLVFLVMMVSWGIVQFSLSNEYWKRQFDVANTQYIVRFKEEKIILDNRMKQWLSKEGVRQKKYYRAVIKGYGSHIEILQGGGYGSPSVKHFFVSESQVSIQGELLKLPVGLFCGNWELINITPEQYIFYLYKN